jgi:hypothetical protein
MSFKHIFVSHAGEDRAAAEQLVEHLRNAGHDTKVDLHDLGLGDDAIDFMNSGIAEAHTIIIMFSAYSAAARWQRLEINSAVWSEVEQSGGRCIVVRLDGTPVPPLLGPKVFGSWKQGDRASLRALVEGLTQTVQRERTASSVVAEALKPDSKNPFRHLRAEFFEDRPDLHAKAFAPPDALKVGALEEMKPCFLEGSRGTGKSMLILSLRARNFLSRTTASRTAMPVFGFYLKLSRGAVCNAGIISGRDWDPESLPVADGAQISDVAAQELTIQMIESLFSELAYCLNNGLLTCDAHAERALADAADTLMFDATDDRVHSLETLLDKLGQSHKKIATFIRRRFIYSETVSVPFASFDLEQLKRTVKLIRRYVPALKSSMFAVLLDEYENLFPYQQRIVNGFVKLGPPDLSVKVAKKFASGDTAGTTTGQELQETHDYTRIALTYDVENTTERSAYHELLRHMIVNIFQSSELGPVDVDALLPEASEAEVPEDRLTEEVARLWRLSVDELEALPDSERRDKFTYYREAAIYRALKRPGGRRPDKRFAGFEQLAFVSSGVIRYFQEILSVSYHLTFGPEAPRQGHLTLPPAKQTQAVHFVSEHNLTTLSRNVERHGEVLKYFLLDLGDCLRHKLLNHSSEPEAARLTINDPGALEGAEMAPLKRILSIGAREGVFQTKEGLPAFRPKHQSDPQPSEFNICRIFAPALDISPRLRWRTTVRSKLLLALLQPDDRSGALKNLKFAMIRSKPPSPQGGLGFDPEAT